MELPSTFLLPRSKKMKKLHLGKISYISGNGIFLLQNGKNIYGKKTPLLKGFLHCCKRNVLAPSLKSLLYFRGNFYSLKIKQKAIL